MNRIVNVWFTSCECVEDKFPRFFNPSFSGVSCIAVVNASIIGGDGQPITPKDEEAVADAIVKTASEHKASVVAIDRTGNNFCFGLNIPGDCSTSCCDCHFEKSLTEALTRRLNQGSACLAE